MKILADYTLEGSYRAAARKNGVSPDTVRRIVQENPDMVKVADTQKNARARDLMSYMQGKADTVCDIIDNGLGVLSDPERMKEAKLRDIATMMAILIDKWSMINAMCQDKAPVQVELAPELEDYAG
nr:MAG TPA: helix-turn-helix domain protein [Caudoviricetes sp.]